MKLLTPEHALAMRMHAQREGDRAMTTQAKHTPEPWEASWTTDKCPFPIGPPVAVQMAGTNDPEHRICEMVAQGDGKYEPDVTEANTLRIVACVNALEGIDDPAALLAACSGVMACDAFAIPGDGQMRRAVEALRVILAKATP